MPRAIKRKQWNADELAWLRAWAKRGKTAAQIADKLGRTANSVRCKAQKLGVTLRPAGQPPVYATATVKAALRAILCGQTHRQIAADVGCSRSTISHWLNERGAGIRVSEVIGD